MEAPDAGRLADELGRREGAAAREGQEDRGQVGDERADLALQAVDGAGQLADAGDELGGDAGDRAEEVGESEREGLEDDAAVEARATGDHLEGVVTPRREVEVETAGGEISPITVVDGRSQQVTQTP